jgi:dynein heavy chain 2
MKSFLAKRGVKEEILSFDARRISNQSRETVERLLQQRSNSFNPDVAKKASAAAAPLAIWYFYKFIMSYLTVTIRLRNNRQNQNICVTF